MRFSLPAVTGTNIPAAKSPEIGNESALYISPVEVFELGKVLVNAAGVATWHPNAGIELPVGGLDLHLRNDDALVNLAGLPAVTFGVTLVGVVGAATAVATLPVPSWSADQSFNWPIAQSADFVGAGVGNGLRLVTAVDDINTSANLPANSSWTVWASPAEASFVFYGFKRNIAGPDKTPKFVEIASAYDSAAAVKPGRSESSSLDLELVHISSMDGLTRYNGRKVTVAVKIVKNKLIQTAWELYTGYGISAMVSRGDGDDEVIAKSTGPFESYLKFTAP